MYFISHADFVQFFRFVNIVEKLKPFFDVDPLLPTNLLYICPLNDFPSLCDHMELNLVLGIMAYNVDQVQNPQEVIAYSNSFIQ